MKNKTIGMGLFVLFGIGTLWNFFRLTNFDRMTPTLWFGTMVMVVLFLGGMYYLMREEDRN